MTAQSKKTAKKTPKVATPKTPDSSTLSAEDARAQSVLKLKQWIEEVDASERMAVGRFYDIPKEYQGGGWHFIRAGKRSAHTAQVFASKMRRLGYMDAPKTVRMRGFEDYDQGDGLYLMIPTDVRDVIKARKIEAQQRVTQTVKGTFMQGLNDVQMALGNRGDVKMTQAIDKQVTGEELALDKSLK